MELFNRRYFGFFAFLFLLSSFGAVFLSSIFKLIFAILATVLALVTGLLIVLNKKCRFAFSVILVSLLFIAVAFFNSFFFISIPTKEAEEYVGSAQAAEIEVLSCESFSEDGSKYIVRALQIGEDEVNIKSYFYCNAPTELSFGDRVIALVEINKPYKNSGVERDIFLSLTADVETPMLLNSAEEVNYFSFDGIVLICKNVRSAFSKYVDTLFGKENGALVKGFLVNDTSDIPFSVHSDFRRSGTLHLLAVSGLHIALLMGSLEILLRKVFVPKRIRCLLVAICAVFFLVLANFAASAVRSVLMLFAVYINYLFSEDNDTVTALFVSVFLITLFSPMSVYDLGMWMSFFATLGLVAVYPIFDRAIPNVKTEKKLLGAVLHFVVWIVKAIILTLVANFFLLPIMWYFFGSISLSAIPANLVLSPLSSVYLPLCAIAVLLGWVPWLNIVLIWAVGVLGKLILFFADLFADMRGGELSLTYSFVPILVIAFTAALSVLLVVRLKHKLWICAPALIFVASFAICLTVFHISAEPQMKYVGSKNNETLIFEDGDRVSVCDISNGAISSLDTVISDVPVYATEIENYIVTHAHKGHIYFLERLLVNIPIRTLYLPLSEDKQELEYIAVIYLVAREYDTDVVFYENGKSIPVLKDIKLNAYFERSDANSHPSVYLTAGDGEIIFAYTDASECQTSIEKGAQSRYFLLGTHGESVGVNNDSEIVLSEHTKLIFATKERYDYSKLKYVDTPYVAPIEKNKIKFILPLE